MRQQPYLGKAVTEQEALDQLQECRLFIQLRFQIQGVDGQQALRTSDGTARGGTNIIEGGQYLQRFRCSQIGIRPAPSTSTGGTNPVGWPAK